MQTQQTLHSLSFDIIQLILTFVPLKDLYSFIQTNTLYSSFTNDTNSLWQDLYPLYCKNNNEYSIIEPHEYKSKLQDFLLYCYDVTWLQNNISVDGIHFSNNNHTLVCDEDGWYTVKAKKKLQSGKIHSWDIVLDVFDSVANNNTFLLFVGIDNDTFPYSDATKENWIVGFINSNGYSYNIGKRIMNIQSKSQKPSYLEDESYEINAGDVISVQVDMTMAQCSTMTIYCNGCVMAVFNELDLTVNEPYYPAISVVDQIQTTIRANQVKLNN
jgi:hypothetical protein